MRVAKYAQGNASGMGAPDADGSHRRIMDASVEAMELRHLRYFAAVARELSFSRAAEMLRVAQPAVSRQVRQLEEEIGVTLIERNSAHVQLTDGGRVFLDHVDRLLTQLDIAVTAAQEAGRGNEGRLVISNDWRLNVGVIPESVGVFREMYPRVAVDLVELTVGEQIAALREGRVQLGFLPRTLFVERDDLSTLFIVASDVVALVPRGHRLARRARIRLVDLKAESLLWIGGSPGPSHRQNIIQVCRLAGFTPKFGKSAQTLQSLFALVASGYGITLLPRCVVSWGDLHLRCIATDCEPVEILAVWRHDETSVHLRRFLEIVRARLA